jgi:polyhydroxybutyrate depolymerase
MSRRRTLTTAAVACALAATAALVLRPDPSPDVLEGGAVAEATATPRSTYKWPRVAPLPPVQDVTGLRGIHMIAAPRVALPGADAGGAAQLSVRSGGHDRPYLLAPARRVAARANPALLIVLPAANTTLRTEYDRYGLDAFRDHGMTVLVAGTYAASWNAGSCCGRPQREGIDDVAAVTAMRADAVARSGADPAHTAVLGHSVGAFMAWRLACTPAFGAAAVVAVSGTLVHDCPRLPRTPALLALNGDRDTTVPLDGSSRVVPILGIAPPSVRGSLREVAGAGSCSAATTFRVGSTSVTEHRGCSGGGRLRLQVVEGQGHPWADLDATRRAAAFLSGAIVGVR